MEVGCERSEEFERMNLERLDPIIIDGWTDQIVDIRIDSGMLLSMSRADSYSTMANVRPAPISSPVREGFYEEFYR